MRTKFRTAVGYPTAGRQSILAETLKELGRQSRRPDAVFICPASPDDFDASRTAQLPLSIELVKGQRGLPAQRNAILDAAADFDILVFFDDDFLPAPQYLAEAEACFKEDQDIVAATGQVLADGIMGPGIAPADAKAILGSFEFPAGDAQLIGKRVAYGCNMALRLAPIHAQKLRFDENLPLYGWAEDADFSRRLAAFGDIVLNNKMAGVHLGTKTGRTSGVRFGYSQIANPYYLCQKGTSRPYTALRLTLQNISANFVRSLWPEPWIDRRGRAYGNALGFLDFLRGRLDPRRILEL
ncbi:MAG TPA: glycosyltransferase [Methylocella sp.]|nr:glycosyltransferase [Methylocella sp.]